MIPTIIRPKKKIKQVVNPNLIFAQGGDLPQVNSNPYAGFNGDLTLPKTMLPEFIRKRIYNAIQPDDYNPDARGLIQKATDVFLGKNRFDDKSVRYTELSKKLQAADKAGELGTPAIDKIRKQMDDLYFAGTDDPYSEDGFAKYMGLPQKNGTFTPSSYNPSVSNKNYNSEYYKMPKEFEQDLLRAYQTVPMPKDSIINEHYLQNNLGENASRGRVLGNFKIGVRGSGDNKYLSYYDTYDLSPTIPGLGKTKIDFIGNPFEIYNRIPIDKEYRVKRPNDNLVPLKKYGGKLKLINL
jgi:hypothetical protein